MKRILFSCALLLLLAVFLEVVLGTTALASRRIARMLDTPWIEPTVPDRRLRHRPNPAHPEHDARGFRNPTALARTDIVAFGDSQTYGTGVGPEDAWPRRLEAMLGRPVYGMAFGGYSPPHSLLLWDEASALEPDVAIEAFYLGNDLFDSFDLVYNQGQLSELRTADPEIQSRVEQAEKIEPIAPRVERLLALTGTGASEPEAQDSPPSSPPANALRKLAAAVARHSKTYGLLRRVRFEVTRSLEAAARDPEAEWQAIRARAEAHPDMLETYDDGRVRATFTAQYRQAALDLDDPRIAEGLQIALRAIDALHERASARGIRFVVLVIPTKEIVFRERVAKPSPAYAALASPESRVMELVRAHLSARRIESIDATESLRAQLASGVSPYPASSDGHPNPSGHLAIAEQVARAIRSRG